ncbi:kinesin motor domain-containing protein, putative [Eimeria tenella]|uniref:Kinesin-like protein n=1 Tax=Eimeria tenella TaxID=5802 RepID=U6KL01_EIMTE|nr:kinesin motor domain-containing protein, putative [Eimeria tenella]CDJ37486.1 kinesin motor domain-containing protein, putative [Eimeria tenella]|eukprot:XP_013228324.1 kinesin motor domain-containing protein, putative [Eimeria tenella]
MAENPESSLRGRSGIEVYLRLRPGPREAAAFRVGPEGKCIRTKVPIGGVGGGFRERSFRFDGILGPQSSQEDVFKAVAEPLVEAALQGVNGTVFAYGPSGSGKTFTMSGSSSSFELRGIIPRALSRAFELAAARCCSADFWIGVSYLEIYQERGFDLLVSKKETSAAQSRRVEAAADARGQLLLRGLSVHPVASEEEALQLLFLGDANRTVSETFRNETSTRSHCIFTLWIASRARGSSSSRKAKLHLVDLAGSERNKTSFKNSFSNASRNSPQSCPENSASCQKTLPNNSKNTLFQETCSINLSLHYLEQVILALQQQQQTPATTSSSSSSSSSGSRHIPYRNSLMTSVLKDSLGGNCRTRMIATATLEANCIHETINTCRFAQVVAQVQNSAEVNEEEDPALLLQRLQRENQQLQQQLLHLRQQQQQHGLHGQPQLQQQHGDAAAAEQLQQQTELTELEKQWCAAEVETFLAAAAAAEQQEETLVAAKDLRLAAYCFNLLRDKYKQALAAANTNNSNNSSSSSSSSSKQQQQQQQQQRHVQAAAREVAALLQQQQLQQQQNSSSSTAAAEGQQQQHRHIIITSSSNTQDAAQKQQQQHHHHNNSSSTTTTAAAAAAQQQQHHNNSSSAITTAAAPKQQQQHHNTNRSTITAAEPQQQQHHKSSSTTTTAAAAAPLQQQQQHHNTNSSSTTTPTAATSHQQHPNNNSSSTTTAAAP